MSLIVPARRKLSRRRFLAFAAAAGTTAVLSEALVTYAPWQDYEAQTRRTRGSPFRTGMDVPAQVRELVRYATLAPSGHNTQPSHAGCGVPHRPPPTDLSAKGRPLFRAIPHRRSTRCLYDGHPIPLADLRIIEAVTPSPHLSMRILTASAQTEAVVEYIRSADQRQYSDQPFINELVTWLRFNKPEAMHSLDGLYTLCSGNPTTPRWLGRRFITTASGGQRSDVDGQNVRSSSGLIVIASVQDDIHYWIEAGRLYERLALTLTALNIKTAFLNRPVEVPAQRSQLQGYLHLGTAQPQLLLRFGYADAMPRSLRRPVEAVLA